MAKNTKVIKSGKKKYTIHRKWAYNNSVFCDKGAIKKKNVKYIVIHYTGNKGDTAKANANYFKGNNDRYAGAQFIIDRKGTIYQCGRLKDACYAVGGFYSQGNGAGKYYKKCTNYNSISIELCDIATQDPSKKQIEATRAIVKYIKKYCKNADKVIRHWDVNGKGCPGRMTGTDNKEWKALKKAIS